MKLPGEPASERHQRARELYELDALLPDGRRDTKKSSWANATWADRAKYLALADLELAADGDDL
jgi:hypothetical protein